jgi:serine/threonine-protein kinase HipA
MHRCLCCNREISNPTEYEVNVKWHHRCIKKFFGTDLIPEIDCTEEELEKLANSAVNKGLTVPGVQKKLSLHLDAGDKAGRLTIVDYPTGYILKPQSDDYRALPEAEYLSMKMAEIAGIKTVPNALIDKDGKISYITKRIDRADGKMYAMEDFCQLSGRVTADKYKSSYENCGKVIKTYSRNVGLDLAEFYYRLLFCFATGNSDMHLKNFSLMEDSPGSRIFGLSSAYDLLPVNVIIPTDKEQMALTLNGKKRNIRKKDFLVLADNLGIMKKAAENMIRLIIRHEDEMRQEVADSYIPENMKKELTELIEERIRVLL